ncbi:MAG: hypothetical protein AB2375_09475 [Tissierellaceae bacterium]
MKVLLSIKPKYVKEIFFGNKRYEYRKKIFKNVDIDTVIVYSSSPVKKVVGQFRISEIIEDNPSNIWEYTKEYSGIDKTDYYKYFEGRDKGFAIKIMETEVYERPMELKEFRSDLEYPPQSFMYIY